MLSPLEFALSSGALLLAATLVALLRPAWIVDHPRVVLGGLALVTLGTAAALVRPEPLGFRIGVDASSEPMLPANDPGEPIYQRAVLDFGGFGGRRSSKACSASRSTCATRARRAIHWTSCVSCPS